MDALRSLRVGPHLDLHHVAPARGRRREQRPLRQGWVPVCVLLASPARSRRRQRCPPAPHSRLDVRLQLALPRRADVLLVVHAQPAHCHAPPRGRGAALRRSVRVLPRPAAQREVYTRHLQARAQHGLLPLACEGRVHIPREEEGEAPGVLLVVAPGLELRLFPRSVWAPAARRDLQEAAPRSLVELGYHARVGARDDRPTVCGHGSCICIL